PMAWREEGIVPDLRAAMTDLAGLTARQGGTVVLFDMDHTEGTYAAAQVLRRLYDRVVVVTPRDRIAEDVPLVTRLGILRRFALQGIEVLPLFEPSPASRLEDGVVSVQNVYTGEERVIGEVALLTYSTPRVADDALAAPLAAAGIELHLVGDCR